ncbi:MAG TPA: mechanosensitive ion channel family protein [Gammaproteobacteria bacterium]|nr:mechanosensitive ion channel family protein [Gammaproteobacteria bacterium]
MDIVSRFVDSLDWAVIIGNGLRILVILVVLWAVSWAARKGLDRFQGRLASKGEALGKAGAEQAKRAETLTHLLRQLVRIAVLVVGGLVVLKEVGVEIAPLLAGAGILGLAVGFGAQNLVRDVISGFFLILEDQVRVGDVAIINGTGGLVEAINFRTIVLRDLAGTVHIFPNGTIATLANMTRDWSAYVFEIGIAYGEDSDRAVAALQRVGEELGADDYFGPLIQEPLEVFGVDRLGESSVVIKGRVKTWPIHQWEVGRELLRRVKKAFDAEGIEIPFPQRTLHLRQEAPPFERAMAEQAGNGPATG